MYVCMYVCMYVRMYVRMYGKFSLAYSVCNLVWKGSQMNVCYGLRQFSLDKYVFHELITGLYSFSILFLNR